MTTNETIQRAAKAAASEVSPFTKENDEETAGLIAEAVIRAALPILEQEWLATLRSAIRAEIQAQNETLGDDE